MKDKKGLSLLEIIVYMSISLALILIVVPAAINFINERSVKDSTLLLRSEINTARLQAMQTNTKRKVTFTLNTDDYQIYREDPDANTWVLVEKNYIDKYKVDLNSCSLTNDQIFYDIDGKAYDGAGAANPDVCTANPITVTKNLKILRVESEKYLYFQPYSGIVK